MKKLILILSLFFSTFASAFSQNELVQILQKPQNVQGDFVQQRFLKSLAKPITTSGEFALVKEKGLLWQMQKPFATSLKVTPEGILQWNGNQWVSSKKMGQSEQIALFLGLLGGDLSTLSSQFDLALSGSSKQWQLKLTPKSLLMKQIFQHIDLQGDQQVKQIELMEKQGDRTVIQFNKLRIDQPLPVFTQQALP